MQFWQPKGTGGKDIVQTQELRVSTHYMAFIKRSGLSTAIIAIFAWRGGHLSFQILDVLNLSVGSQPHFC